MTLTSGNPPSPRVRIERAASEPPRRWAHMLPPSEGAPRVPPAMAEALAARQRELGAGPRAEANARALADPATLCVVAGQQPGLFGGSLLTFHKAAGAIHLAGTLTEAIGRRVVPVFWSASDDHDLDEVRCAWVMDREGQPRRVCVEAQSRGESVRHVPLTDEAAQAALEDLAAALPPTPRAAEALALAARPAGADLGTWSLACLLRILGDQGLVVVEPQVIAPWSGEFLASLVERGLEVTEAVRGTPGPLEPDPDDAPVFVRETRTGPRVRVRRGVDVAAVAARVRRDPLLASGDVVGRVLHQNAVLPVTAFLVGPAEREYVLQTREAHLRMGVGMPQVEDRPSATWVDGKSGRLIRAFGVSVREILGGAEQPAAEDGGVGQGLADLGARIHTLWEEAAPLLARGGEGAAALRRGLERLEEEWSRADGAAREAFERDRGVGRARWARLQAALLPRGRPQERSISPLSLVARHGLEAVREGLAALDPRIPGHVLIHLEDGA